MNSKVLWGIIAVVVILGGIWWLAGSDTTPNGGTGNALDGYNKEQSNNNSGGNEQTTGVQGRVVFSVTDAAVNVGTLSEVNVVVSKVEVFSQARGWVTLSSTPRAYNLLQLKADNQSKVLADLSTTVGDYSQVRITVDSAAVKTKAGVTADARLPGKSISIPLTTKVQADGTASVNIDFEVDKSLHTTTDGKYVFAPVVKAQSKSNATVTVGTNGVVTISGGNTDSTQAVGMDVDGSVKVNFQLNSGAKLNVDASGVIKVQ